jgi:hypothetical protein
VSLASLIFCSKILDFPTKKRLALSKESPLRLEKASSEEKRELKETTTNLMYFVIFIS